METLKYLKRFVFFPVALCVLPSLFMIETAASQPGVATTKASGTVESRLAAPKTALSLKDCLHAALKDNPLLSEAHMGILAAQKGIESATGKHFPRLSLDGSYTRRQDAWPYIPAQSATIIPHFSDEFAHWQIMMTLPIYQGGQIMNGVKLADIRKSIQEENYRLTRNEILANVINTYNKVLQLRELRNASLSSVEALEKQLRNTRLMADVGRVAKVDLLKVEVQLANERQRLLSCEEGLSTSCETLQYLLGKREPVLSTEVMLSDSLVMRDFLPPVFEQAMETGKKNRPEYLLAEKNLQETAAHSKITKGRLLPNIAGFGGYIDQYGFKPWYGEANWFAGVNVSIPLFESTIYSDISRDAILEQKAGQHLRAVQDRLRLDILSALSSIRESRNRVLTSRKATEQAKESFRIEGLRYQSGAGAVVDMLLAQAAYMTAVGNHSQSLFDYNAALVAYRKATGTMEDFLK